MQPVSAARLTAIRYHGRLRAADAERGLPVAVDFTAAQIWDASTVAVLDSIQAKYVEHGLEVSFTGLDDRSTLFHGRLTGTLN